MSSESVPRRRIAPDEWAAISRALDLAFDLPQPERIAFVRGVYAHDPMLLAELLRLLAGADTPDRILDRPAWAGFPQLLEDAGSLPFELPVVLANQFRLDREIGRGGMGVVFLGYDLRHDRQVAVKVLRPTVHADGGIARFLSEIRTTARLRHPNIVPLFDSGEIGDSAFFVMPYLPGESLRARLERAGPLPVADAMRIASAILAALVHSHEQGIVHRDVKPSNVLLTADQALLADFGIARSTSGAHDDFTESGVGIGTPGYMAPEQAAAEPTADHRVDIYAFGLVAFEALVGEPAFRGPSAEQILRTQVNERPPSVADLRPETPPGLAALIAQCLERRPVDRPQTAREVLRVLESLGEGITGDSQPSVSGIRARLRRAVTRTRRHVLIGVPLVVAAAGGIEWYRAAHRSNALDANALAVAPFDVLPPDLSIWREGLVDILSRNFDGLGTLHTISPSVVVKGWSGRADPVSADAMARRTGAGLVLFGSLLRIGGDSVRLHVNMRDVSIGKTVMELELADDASRIGDRLIDSTTVAVMRWLGPKRLMGSHRFSAMGTKSIPALKEYLTGQQLYRHPEIIAGLDSAAVHLNRAIELDSTFALAYLGLSDVYAVSAAEGSNHFWLIRNNASRAATLNRGLGLRDSLTIVADSLYYAADCAQPWAAPPQHMRAMLSRMFAIVGHLTAEYPSDPDATYLYADAQFHCGSVLHAKSDRELLAAFDRSIAADSAFFPAYGHAVMLAFSMGGPPLGRRYMEAFGRNNARFGSLLLPCWAFMDSATSTPERLAVLANRAAPTTTACAAFGTPDPVRAESLVLQHVRTEMMKGRLERWMLDFAIRNAAGVLAYRGRLAAVRNVSDVTQLPVFLALATLGSVQADSARAVFNAWQSMKNPPRDCQWILDWWAAHADSAGIAGCVNHVRLASASDTGRARNLKPVLILANAFFALARSDTVGAEKAFDLLPDSMCALFCGFAKLTRARVLAARGRLREALASLEWQAVSIDDFATIGEAVPVYLERARLASRLRNREEAANSYRLVSDAWNGADSILHPRWVEAQQALERLQIDSQGVRQALAPTRRK